MGGGRAERCEGSPNGLERIGGVEGGNRVFEDEVPVWSCTAVCMVVPVQCLRTSCSVRRMSLVAAGRARSRAATLGDKSGGVGPSHGEDRNRKATVVGKGRAA